MKIAYVLLVLLLLAGCGQKLEQSQILTAAPEEESEPETPPDRTFVVSNGVITSLVFTPGGTYNGTNPPVTTASVVSGSLNIDSETNNNLDLSLTEGARTLHFGLATGADALVTGQLYDFTQGAFVDLLDDALTWRQTALSSGGLTIVNLSDSSIEVDFNFMQVQPVLGQGTFDISGHLTADLTGL